MFFIASNIDGATEADATSAALQDTVVAEPVESAQPDDLGDGWNFRAEVVVAHDPIHLGEPEAGRKGEVEVGLHQRSPMAFLAL